MKVKVQNPAYDRTDYQVYGRYNRRRTGIWFSDNLVVFGLATRVRARPSGLAAASVNPACMLAMDDFITIGTQMKIERPGRACAITPSDPVLMGLGLVLTGRGTFTRCDTVEGFPINSEKMILLRSGTMVRL